MNILIFLAIFFIFNINLLSMEPPKAKKIEHITEIHGIKLIDNYFWLRDRNNPEVIKYLEDENNYADYILSDTKAIQEKLYNEIISRIKQTDMGVPKKIDNYYYYYKINKGQNYYIFCRKKDNLNNKEEILLDENKLAKGKNYFDVGFISVSPNHELMAYGVDYKGDEKYTIFIKNLKTKKLLSKTIKNASTDFQWANDSKTFYYTTLSEINQADKVWKHILGQKNKEDELVYTEKDERYFLNLSKSNDKSIITINLSSKDETEVWYIDANNPDKPKLIKEREKELKYTVESYNDQFVIITNKNAPEFKIVTVSKNNPDINNWVDFMPYNEEITIRNVQIYKNYWALQYSEDGLEKLKIYNTQSKTFYNVDFPEEDYYFYFYDNNEYNENKIRISYTSLKTPNQIFDYDMKERKFQLLKEQEVLGNYNKYDYETKRIFATAKDGKKVPISLIYKKGLQLNGENPTLLYSYGSYGYSTNPYFSSVRLSLLDRGFVFALAHIRGGSEYGYRWYKDGKMKNKMNTFTDFIACAEELISRKYTNPEKLVIEGGSAGGLLMGAVTNMRPDLFKLVLAHVPFVDVINTMLDSTIPLTVAEYQEWGNPNIKEDFDYMYRYSPYDNVKKTNYPNMLVRAGLNDPRVSYWEPAKWVAKLRELKTDNNYLILITNMASGHGGSSGRYEKYKEIAVDYAFIFKVLGIKD